MKHLLTALALVALVCSAAAAANTAKKLGNRIVVYTSDGSTNDVDFATYPGIQLEQGCTLTAIYLYPNAVNDVAKVWDKRWAEEPIWLVKDGTGGGKIIYFERAHFFPLVKGQEVSDGAKLFFYYWK